MKPQRGQFSPVAGFGFLSACRGVTSSGEFLTSRGARGIPAFPWLHSPDWPQHKDLDQRWRPTVAAGGQRWQGWKADRHSGNHLCLQPAWQVSGWRGTEGLGLRPEPSCSGSLFSGGRTEAQSVTVSSVCAFICSLTSSLHNFKKWVSPLLEEYTKRPREF